MSLELVTTRIKTKVPLASLVGEHVKLEMRSGRPVGVCPFHQEKSGSFTIFDDHYYCFGCQARGDAINFVRDHMGLGFTEALRWLASKYSIDVPELDSNKDQLRQRDRQASLFRLMSTAQTWFQNNLHSERGQYGIEYLKSRGFSDENIKAYGFGLSFDDNAGLIKVLQRHSFVSREIIDCSLGNRSQNNESQLYDFFRHRLMIPIADKHGRTIAFGGRTMGDHQAKYKNSRETPLFDKSHTIYGFHQARDSIRKSGYGIITEGYMDTLQLWNHGINQSLACLGTALTLHQLRQLAGITKTVYLVFDGDQAGKNASLRTISHALELPQLHIKVVRLPDKQDPDDYVRSHGADGFRKLMDQAQDLLDFAITEKIETAHGLAIPELISSEFAPWLASIHDKMQRLFLINRISSLTGLPAQGISEVIQQKIRGIKGARNQPANNPATLTAQAPQNQDQQANLSPEASDADKKPMELAVTRPLNNLEVDLLGHLFFSKPEELDLKTLKKWISSSLDLDELWQSFAMELVGKLEQNTAPDTVDKALWVNAAVPRVMRFLEHLEKSREAFNIENRRAKVETLVKSIKTKTIKKTIATLKSQLTQPGPAQETDSQEILKAVIQLNQELIAIEKSEIT